MNKLSKKAIRRDHELVKEVEEIEKRITEVCWAFSKELGVEVEWSDVRELAGGTSPFELFGSK